MDEIYVYVLVLYICMPGAWSNCSSGILESRIDNIPTKIQCETILDEKKLDRKLQVQSGMCVPQFVVIPQIKKGD